MWSIGPVQIFVLCQILCHVAAFSAISIHNNDRIDEKYIPKSHCFSCASFIYLPLWSQLMHHYYPPKNFTDRCWVPDSEIGLVPCSSACFTLVERIDGDGYADDNQHRGVIRGCVDRLLLFGLDDDVRNVLSAYDNQRVCRHTDRKLLRLFPLSEHTDVVTFCSCQGDFCNESNMVGELNSSSLSKIPLLSIFLILTAIIDFL